MPNGITGSGGVDTSALDGLISKLESVLDVQQQVNQNKIAPKVDDTDIKKINNEISNLRKDIENTQRTNLELWNTKDVQKTVNSTINSIDKIYNKFKDTPDAISEDMRKSFLESYTILETYGNRFGQNLTGKYKDLFNGLTSILNKEISSSMGIYEQQEIKTAKTLITNIINEAKKQAQELLNFDLGNSGVGAIKQANDTVYKQRKQALLEEKQAAIESANAVREAERQKREEYLATRDTMVNELKSAFDEIRSRASNEEYFHIDESSWSSLQQKFYDLTQLMSQMGFEVHELEDSFGQLQNKVYVPTSNIDDIRNSMSSAAAEADEMTAEVDRMSGSLSNIDDSKLNQLKKDLEFYKQEWEWAANKIYELQEAMDRMYTSSEYDQLAAEAGEWLLQLNKLKEEFTELKQKYDTLVQNNGSGENALSETFDINDADKFVDILTQIAQHLKDIKTALGTVDDTNGFTNIIQSVDLLLEKLDRVQEKVGTGINNITINQGVDKSAQEQTAATNDYIRSTMSRYKNAYTKVSDVAGGEEKLFAYINTAINFKGGIDALYKTFSSASVSEIQSSEGQIYRLIDFFKVLRQAISSDEFSLDLTGIRLPSSNDSYIRSQIREKSGLNKSNEEVLDLDDEKLDLTGIIDKLEEIRTLLSEISQKNLFGDSLDFVSQKLDEIINKFDNIVSKVEVINDTPILSEKTDTDVQEETNAEQTAAEVKQATEAVREEGEAAEIAADKKKEFAQANKEVADSATATASATKEATNGINEEADAAQNAEQNISSIGSSADDSAAATRAWIEELEQASGKTNKLDKATKEAIKSSKEMGKNGSSLDLWSTELAKLEAETEKTIQKTAELTSKIEKQKAVINNTSLKTDSKLSSSGDFSYSKGLTTEINKINQSITDLKTRLNSVTTESGLKQWMLDFATLKEQIKGVNDAIKEEESAYKNANKEEEQASKRAATNLTNQTKLLAEFKTWVAKNSAAYATYGDEIEAVYSKLGSSAKLSADELREVTNEINRIKTAAADTDKLGSTLFTTIKGRAKSLVAYISTFASFYQVVSYVREVISTVQELNTQMIELAKVSDQSIEDIKADFNSYAETAKDLGATISDTISATSDWARMGYNIPDSQELARVALLYKNVGDGIDIATANESLISTLQGYQMTADEAEHIVDVFNEVSNNFAISSGGIGEALQRSAASLNAANTSLEKSVALVTSANTVLQNPESVGTVFKTLSARIRGAKTDLEELGEEEDEFTQSTSKLQGLVKGLTGFDILEEDGETFKDIYDILIGIGKEWDNLTDVEQASLGEALAGKRNSNALYAILDNIETLEQAYETAENSAGSAMREQENYEKGIEYSINRAKAALEELSNDMVNSDFLKGLIDDGTKGIELLDNIIDKIGVLKTVIIGISTVVGSRKLGILDTQNSNTLIGALTQSRLGKADVNSYQSLISEIQSHGLASNYFVDGLDVSQLKGSETFIRNITDIQTKLKETGGTGQDAINKITAVMRDAEEKANTLSTKFTSLGKTLLNGLASAAISTVVSLLVTKLSDMADKLIITRKEAKALSDQFHDTFSSAVADQSKGLSQISGIEKEYEELSEGVSALGENVSLTDTQFERYHEITQIIAENIPSLIQGYDDQGEAIIRLKDNVKDLTQAYNENQEAAALERYNEVDANGGVIAGVYQNAKNDIEPVTVETSHSATGLVAHEQTIDIIQQLETRKKLAQASVKELQQLWKEGSIYEKQLLEEVGFRDVLSDSELSTIQSKLQKNSTQLEKTLEHDAKTVSEAGLTYAQAWEGYYTELTSEQQKYVNSVMNSMDFDYIYENGLYDQDTMELYVQNLMNTVKSLSSEDIEKIQIGIDISTQWNNNELSYEEYIKKLQEFNELLETLFPGNEQLQTSIKLLFDIPEIEDVEEEIDKRVNRGQRVISNKYGSNEQPTFNEESDNNNSLGGKTPLAQDFLNGEKEVKVPLVAEPQPITSDQYEKWGELYTEFQKKLSTEEAKVLNDLSDDELVITYDFESVEDFEDWFAGLQAEADENPIEIKTKFSEQAADIDSMKDAFGGLATAYETSQTGEKVSASDLAQVADDMGGVTFNVTGEAAADINALSNAVERYSEKLMTAQGDTETTQEAADELATAYVDQSGVLEELLRDVDNVDDAYKEYVVDQLKAQGITNAEEVVTSRLTKQYKAYSSALKKVSSQIAQYRDNIDQMIDTHEDVNDTASKMIDSVTEMLSVYNDEGEAVITPKIDESFILENLADILSATEGDIDAYDRLMLKVAELNAQTILIDAGIDISDAEVQAAEIMDLVAQADAMDIEVGASIDDAPFLNALYEMMASSKTTADAVASAFESMGYSVEWTPNKYKATVAKAIMSNGGTGNTTADLATQAGIERLESMEVEMDVPSLTITRSGSSKASTGTGASYGGSGGSSSSSGGGGGDSGGSDDTSTDEDTFDWIEVKIDRLEEQLARLDEAIDDVYDNWGNRNDKISEKIKTVTDEIETQKDASKRYLEEANKYADLIGKEYVEKVQNGEIDIETIKVETSGDDDSNTLIENIQEYQTWYEKYIEASDQVNTLSRELNSYYKDLFDNVESQYEDLLDEIEKKTSIIEERITRTEEHGFFVDEAYYTALKSLEEENFNKLEKEREELITKLNNAVTTGKIKKGSEAWYEMYLAIQDVNKAIEESMTNTVKLNNEIRQLKWDKFDWVEERMDDFAEEADFLIKLLQGEETIDDRGYFNNRGFANAALIGAKYDDALAEAQRYADAIKEIDKDLATEEGKYDKNLIDRKEELVSAYRSAIEAAEDEKQAMKSLVEEAVKQHLDYLSKLIDKYKDALSTMKSTYEYAKNINDQTKNISNLEKQLAAYQGDTSEEARKKRQELQNQLDSAQQQLEETQWDKYISETGEMLDNLYNNYETYLNDKLSNVAELMTSMIDMINQGTYTVPGAVTLGMNSIIAQLSGEGSITTAVKDTTISIKDGMDEIKNEYGITTQKFEDFGNTANGTKDILSAWSNGKYTNESTFVSKLDEVKNEFSKITNGAADTIKNAILSKSKDITVNDNGTVSATDTYKKDNGNGGAFGNGSGDDDKRPDGYDNSMHIHDVLPWEGRGWYQREGMWHYRKDDGSDITSEWYQDEDSGWWYYFDPGGVMAQDQFVEGYWLDDDGHMMPDKFQWHGDDSSGWWFGTEDGSQYVKGESVYIDGKWYDFDDNGWMKYASGSRSIPTNRLAWTQDEGQELIYRTTDGALLTPLNQGDMVFTNEMSQRLWEIASGQIPIGGNIEMPIIGGGTTAGNVTANNNITIELPNVENYDDFKKAMKQDRDLEKFWQEITIGQMMGNARLKKNKY